MSEIISISIIELMEQAEQWLLDHGYKKSTLGVYKATWNKFRVYSASPIYDRNIAEKFLLRYFGVDVNAIDQKLDTRMRHARRHIDALDEFLRTGQICRRKVRGIATIDDDRFDLFFAKYLYFCKEQNYSKPWIDNTVSGLKIFLLAIHASNTASPEGINMDTINRFSEAMRSADEICINVRQMRCRQVGAYLHWLYLHGVTIQDFSLHLPKFKRTPAKIPQIWTAEEIEQILATIDTENPTGKRNYAMFLIMARTGLRISDVVALKFSNIDWKNNSISLAQQKTGNSLGLPLSKELGMAIISYLKSGRPQSSSDFIFIRHTAPYGPLDNHNNFNSELRKYMRRAGITVSAEKRTGVHTFRHSFATNMLKAEASLQDISQILGHSNINVTETYLRVDIEQLRQCALDLEVLL